MMMAINADNTDE